MAGKESKNDRLDREDLKLFRESADDHERRRAASRLFERHQDRIYAWCFRYVEDHEHALELSQDVMLNAFRSLPDYQHRARFSSWLFVIARNRCLRGLRKPLLHQELNLDPDMLHSATPGPGRALERKLDEQALWSMIDERLDPREQDAIRLRCVEGLPVDAITKVLNIEDVSGARGMLQRARRKLRAGLADRDSH